MEDILVGAPTKNDTEEPVVKRSLFVRATWPLRKALIIFLTNRTRRGLIKNGIDPEQLLKEFHS